MLCCAMEMKLGCQGRWFMVFNASFPSPFHKDYLTTKITLTIKNSSLGVLDTTLCDKVCQWFATGQWHSINIAYKLVPGIFF
jgi:hypothetical protein